MMKEKIEVIKYNTVDINFTGLIELQKSIFKNTTFDQCLIYFDSNFATYFTKILKSEKDSIFILKVDGKLAGFTHFKYFNQTLFLNNIAIDKSYQGKGYGSFLLKQSINLTSHHHLSFFELDVFISNEKALKWYLMLGLKEVEKSKWYQMFQKRKIAEDENIYFANDENGFKSIFFNNIKIATIINKNLIFHDQNYLNHVCFEKYDKIIIATSDDAIIDLNKFIFIDQSVRMKTYLKTILNKLQ